MSAGPEPERERSRAVLALCVATMTFVLGMPVMAMPVLFKEIASDLGLSLVQIGAIWGFGALAGAVFGVPGGILGDLRGPKWVVGTACVAGGVIGAARGLSGGYATLAVTTLLMGVVSGAIPMNVHKTAAHWFSAHDFGKANSVLSLGIGVGTTLGSLVSASLLSPWLGGWRHVTFFYGAISCAIGIAWLLSPQAPGMRRPVAGTGVARGLWNAVSRVLSVGGYWPMVAGGMCYGAAVQGLTGYLPLYLAGSGWSRLSADGALSVFSAASVIGVLPLAILAERRGRRRAFLMAASLTTCVGLVLLSVSTTALVWPAVAAMGLFREAFMAVTITMTVQLVGIGPRHAGTALGLSMSLSGLARFVAPPLGNSLARFGPGYPFLLWSAIAGAAAVSFIFVKARRSVAPEESAPEAAASGW